MLSGFAAFRISGIYVSNLEAIYVHYGPILHSTPIHPDPNMTFRTTQKKYLDHYNIRRSIFDRCVVTIVSLRTTQGQPKVRLKETAFVRATHLIGVI